MPKTKRTRRNAAGYTPAQQKVVDQLRRDSKSVPVGLFGHESTPEQLQARLAQASAAGVHRTNKRWSSAGRTTRVGSRSQARRAAVNDQR